MIENGPQMGCRWGNKKDERIANFRWLFRRRCGIVPVTKSEKDVKIDECKHL